jgi:hypothetical protein
VYKYKFLESLPIFDTDKLVNPFKGTHKRYRGCNNSKGYLEEKIPCHQLREGGYKWYENLQYKHMAIQNKINMMINKVKDIAREVIYYIAGIAIFTYLISLWV